MFSAAFVVGLLHRRDKTKVKSNMDFLAGFSAATSAGETLDDAGEFCCADVDYSVSAFFDFPLFLLFRFF